MGSVAHSERHEESIPERRFAGLARLYGDQGVAQLQAASVCVIGVGGVGSWTVEALARSALGAITMIDLDVVAVSNINRQLPALNDTLGRDKTAVLSERIAGINPTCNVTIHDEFLSRENLAKLIQPHFDFVIDCIDDFRLKAALIDFCKRSKISLLTVGGAGGQIDASKIRIADLSRTQHDVLLSRTRKLLRQDYGFTKNLKRTFAVPCVYSNEQLRYPNGQGGTCAQRPPSTAGGQSNALNCAGGLGSVAHVTASFGLLAAGFAVNQISQ